MHAAALRASEDGGAGSVEADRRDGVCGACRPCGREGLVSRAYFDGAAGLEVPELQLGEGVAGREEVCLGLAEGAAEHERVRRTHELDHCVTGGYPCAFPF